MARVPEETVGRFLETGKAGMGTLWKIAKILHPGAPDDADQVIKAIREKAALIRDADKTEQRYNDQEARKEASADHYRTLAARSKNSPTKHR